MRFYKWSLCAALGSFLLVAILAAQSKPEEDIILITNLNSAKKLYMKGQGQQAYNLLKVLLDNHPKNTDLNYLLAVLSVKVKKDIMAMRKFYRKAKRNAPGLKNPMELSEAEINALFAPKIVNPSDINLRELFKKLDKNLSRESWTEARIQLRSGTSYLENCSKPLRSRYALYGLQIYNYFDSLMLGLKYFTEVDPTYIIDQQEKKLYEELKDKWALKHKQFRGKYGNRQRMLQQFTTFLAAHDYKTTLLFADLVTDIHKDNLRMLTLINMYRLDARIGLNHISRARKLMNNLRRIVTNQNFPAQFSEKLNSLESRLLFKESKIRIGAQIADADSLFLKGNPSDGQNRYAGLIESQQSQFLNTDFIYVRLSRILREIGDYKGSRKALQKVSNSFSDLTLLKSTRDTISRCQQLEQTWQAEMPQIKQAYQKRNYSRARNKLLRFTESPYLRFGLKDSTYSMLIRCYQQMGYTDWARGLAYLSSRYVVDGSDQQFISAFNRQLGENRLHPAIKYAELPVNLRFHHKDAVQIELLRLPSASVSSTVVHNTAPIKLLALETKKLNGGGVYQVIDNEQKTKTNYILGIGGVLISILFILAR